jgi:hypothetical protein
VINADVKIANAKDAIAKKSKKKIFSSSLIVCLSVFYHTATEFNYILERQTVKHYDFLESEIMIDGKAEKKMVNLGSIVFEDLDFNSPVQRKGDLWKRKYKVDLIKSIFAGIPCGAVHLVTKEIGDSNRWVLDAKQRLITIKSFKNNEFYIKIKNNDGKIESLFWRDIVDANSKWKYLKTKFNEYQMELMIYPPMGIEEMLKLFKTLNNQVAPTHWEKLYSESYLTKLLLEYCYDNFFVAKEKILGTSIAKDHRHTGIRLFHGIMHICNGNRFDDIFAPRGLSAKKLSESAKQIQKMLIENGIDAIKEYDQDTLEKLKINKICKEIKTVTNWLNMSLRHKNNLINSKKLDAIFVFDIVCFFVKKLRENILTNCYVEQNYEKIIDFIIKWNNYKNEHKDSKSRSTQESNIRKRIESMEEIFNKTDIDRSIKNKKLSKSEKRTAALESTGVDPLNGIILEDDIAKADHVQSKATTGLTQAYFLSEPSNRLKSGTTKETKQKEIKYMQENC